MLEIDSLSFSYGERQVLKDISFSIKDGERVALLGNNGCGKTTLFKCISGLLKPDSGTIKGGNIKAGDSIGLVFQEADAQLIASTVEKEISFGLMNLKLDNSEIDSRIDSSLEKVLLSDYKKRAVHYLSGGEKKRVCIADIIAMQPHTILFDEPTAYLDNINTVLFKKILSEIKDTVIITTHDIDFAYETADRFIIMADGEIVADGGVEIFEKSDIIEHSGIAVPRLWQFSKLLGVSEPCRTMQELKRYIK